MKMPVKITIFTLLFALVFASGCSDDDNIVPNQQRDIRRHLTNQSGLIDSLQGNNVWVWRLNNEDTYDENRPGINPGDLVEFYFDLYLLPDFIGSNPTPVFSNRQETIDNLRNNSTPGNSVNTLYWDTEPYGVRFKRDKLMEGLEIGLNGRRENDTLNIFITSELAYGDKEISTIPKNSGLVYHVIIKEIQR